MKLKKPKIKVTNDIIENQVICDLIAFQKIIKKQIEWPIDLEFFTKSLWGIEVEYKDSLIHPESGEKIVGCLAVEEKKIIINLSYNESNGARFRLRLFSSYYLVCLDYTRESKSKPNKICSS